MKRNRTEFNYNLLTAIVAVITVVFATVGIAQLLKYDDTILDIYADQQDAYVQLVLDQINMKKFYSDEEIIEDILNSLDASGQKYWTLSKDESIIFVKNVTETYRYKGFTTETFYISDSAKGFLDGLTVNYVTHALINVDEDLYVASGAEFEYHGDIYRICLLTDKTVILNNNNFLSAKVTIVIVMLLMIAGSLIGSIALGTSIVVNRRKINKLKEDNEKKNLKIIELNKEIKMVDSYHTKWHMFDESLLPAFSQKLEQTNCYPISLMLLRFDLENDRDIFLEKAQFSLDKKILRFNPYNQKELLLVFVSYELRFAHDAVMRIMDSHAQIIATAVDDGGYRGLDELYKEMRREVDGDEQ